ncbi:Ku protein [Povalibacter sp.]|uniref:non-homologous end joining protein Ku n=1 Tax=Povalibacter sp. TaxID=1962978 RepID=UPI002F3E5564
MPRRTRSSAASDGTHTAPVRSIWSGTITFGLVSIPVDLLSAVQPRHTAMKLVDKDGHALGRQFRCSRDDKKLNNDDLVRGYETDSGKMLPVTDAEFESVAPEMSGDIDLHSFVPLEHIPALYFQKPYFLAPSGKSSKAYHLLAATMERTGRVGIGGFIMRGHEYLVAILSDHGVLRADTLRYADEIRSPGSIGLPKLARITAGKVTRFVKAIEALKHRTLSLSELEDRDAEALENLARSKRTDEDRVIHRRDLEDAEPRAGASAQIIDLMDVLRKSLAKDVVVRSGASSPPVSLAVHRARRLKAKAKSDRRKAPGARRKSAKRKSAKH